MREGSTTFLSVCQSGLCRFVSLKNQPEEFKMTKDNYENVPAEILSGETEALEERQNDFIRLLTDDDQRSEDSSSLIFPDASDQSWTFDYEFVNHKECDRFFQSVGKIITTIPADRYILRYLLDHYAIPLDHKQRQQLADYAEGRRWRLQLPKDPSELDQLLTSLRAAYSASGDNADPISRDLEKGDCQQLLTALCGALAAECPSLSGEKQFSTYFHNLFTGFSIERLRELALALDWDYRLYQGFRIKAFRLREINFLDRSEISMYLALRHAKECGLSAQAAFEALNRLYPPAPKAASENDRALQKQQKKAQREAWEVDSGNTSMELMNSFLPQLEDQVEDAHGARASSGPLKAEYRKSLFSSPLPVLQDLYQKIDSLKQARPKRHWQTVFFRQWEDLCSKVGVDEVASIDSHMDTESRDDQFGRHFLFRWLYGENVERLVKGSGGSNRLENIKDRDMIRLAPEGVTDYYLDSSDFLSTRIRDRDFYQDTYSSDEEHQRNLLLTTTFLNYAFDQDLEYYTYEERVAYFEVDTARVMQECGFMSLNRGYAYDAFLILLLSCTNPLDLFQYIWCRKTGSGIHLESGSSGQT